LEEEFFEQYKRVQGQLQRLLNTSATAVVQSGEAMLGLWGALRAVIRPGTRVLSVSSGVYGTGIGTMAEQLGASVKRVDVAWDVSFIEAVQNIRQLASEWQPELITVRVWPWYIARTNLSFAHCRPCTARHRAEY
jgi:aspartate aminotransferase-like enzyme